MPAATRLGDYCTGHGDWPPRPCVEGSDSVFINALPAHRVGDAWAVHCDDDDCHGSVLAQGSPSVYVNGKALGRIGDPVVCGSRVATGSPNVFSE